MTTLPARNKDDRASFFRTYKPGQGFWTRLGTGIGAGLIILFTVQFLYSQLPAWAGLSRNEWPIYAILTAVVVGMSVLTWWLINRPKHAEFLIATDQEMKKVNWTGRRELIGSTKVVVFFMLFMAAVLFFYDLFFGYFFFFIRVLKIAPFTA